MSGTPYSEQAAKFRTRHGFPAPPLGTLEQIPCWPIPFCEECCDWHYADEDHSAQPTEGDYDV